MKTRSRVSLLFSPSPRDRAAIEARAPASAPVRRDGPPPMLIFADGFAFFSAEVRSRIVADKARTRLLASATLPRRRENVGAK